MVLETAWASIAPALRQSGRLTGQAHRHRLESGWHPSKGVRFEFAVFLHFWKPNRSGLRSPFEADECRKAWRSTRQASTMSRDQKSGISNQTMRSLLLMHDY